nr:tetratricopeptide repeat protein [uncultured Desulfobulbus sp.]
MIFKHTCRYLFLIFLFIAACQANSLIVSWTLDDLPNIVNNQPIKITNYFPATLWHTFFSKPFAEGNFYRPIANFTFAINWLIGQDNPRGYHVINLLIHICSTFFLFRSTILLLNSPQASVTNKKYAYTIALLASLLWAVNPIQVPAVTYIVQRMASMAAMFFILALYTYIKARQARESRGRITYFASSLLCFLLALGCKENAITLIPILFAIEYFFLHIPNDRFSTIALRTTLIATLCFFAAGTYYIIDHNLLEYLNKPIGSRPFSIGERLLTQPSILLFYLSLIFFPSPSRLSIDHSFPLSTSPWQPWTTLPAILLCLGLIAFAVLQRRKSPLLGFAILFFFINHLVESTFIPLEMIFEHRNYLPSMFLFLPVAAGLCTSIETSKQSSRLIYAALLFSIPVVLIALGLGTYSRNKVWATEESLWTDALAKAPTNARPYAKLGEIYGWQKEKSPENLRTAVALFEKALHLESPRTSFKAAIVGNIGKVYFKYGLLDLAVSNYQRSLAINPNFITSRFDLTNALTLQGKFSQALEQIDQVIAKNDQQSRFFNLKAHLLLWLDRPDEAAENTSRAMHITQVNKERYFYNCGVALTRAGNHPQGLWFLLHALKGEPDNRRILCSLIENRLLAKDFKQGEYFADQLISLHGLPQIKVELERLPKDYSSVPVDVKLVAPVIFMAANKALAAMQ